MRIFVFTLLVLGLSPTPVLHAQSGRVKDPPPDSRKSTGQNSNQSDEIVPNSGADKSETVEGDVIRVDTSLVTVPVTVMDRNGRFIPDLDRKDFKIFDNGVEQKIAYFAAVDQPFTVALVLDTSNSTEFRLEDIQDAAITFVNKLSPQDRVMVVSFDEHINVLTEATSDRAQLVRAIRRARTGGGTRLYDAVNVVIMDKMKAVSGRKAIVLFTDGVDTTSHRASYASTVRDAQEADSLIYPIAYNTMGGNFPGTVGLPGGRGGIIFGIPWPGTGGPAGRGIPGSGGGSTPGEYRRGEEYLHDLASVSGGRFYRGDTMLGLSSAFEQVADELRRQYSLGYYPSPPGRAGERRAIRVTSNQPGLVVKSRDSYIYSSGKVNQQLSQFRHGSKN